MTDMFRALREDRASCSQRLKPKAELSLVSRCPDLIRHETQRQASRHLLSGFARGMRGVLREWWRRKNDRRELARLDERMLRDIGLTRFDVDYEINKPFWRE
jgi:uncharacterized protein YjiS (DUF1127 family)